MQWIIRHPILLLTLAAPLLGIGYLVHWMYWSSRPTTNGATVESITVRLVEMPWHDEDIKKRQPQAELHTTDQGQIAAL